MSARSVVLIALSLFVFCLAPCAVAGSLFKVPEPKLIYRGTAPGVSAGAVVIRKSSEFDQAIAPLDPGFGAERPDLSKRTVIRVVGRARDNSCRETVIVGAETKNFSATIRLEERVPEQGCQCAPMANPPRAWLIEVARIVRKARVKVTDVVVPCDEALQGANPSELVQVFQGSWDHEPGSEIITDEGAFRTLLTQLSLGDRGPKVDFSTHRIVVVTARPRQNGCRKSTVVETSLASSEEAVFTLEESYPGKGQLCSAIFLPPKVFLYRVPVSVTRARTVTRELR